MKNLEMVDGVAAGDGEDDSAVVAEVNEVEGGEGNTSDCAVKSDGINKLKNDSDSEKNIHVEEDKEANGSLQQNGAGNKELSSLPDESNVDGDTNMSVDGEDVGVDDSATPSSDFEVSEADHENVNGEVVDKDDDNDTTQELEEEPSNGEAYVGKENGLEDEQDTLPYSVSSKESSTNPDENKSTGNEVPEVPCNSSNTSESNSGEINVKETNNSEDLHREEASREEEQEKNLASSNLDESQNKDSSLKESDEINKVGKGMEESGDTSVPKSLKSEPTKEKENCKVLMFSFVDQSTSEERKITSDSEKNDSDEATDKAVDDKAKEPKNTISPEAEVATPAQDDASADSDSDDVDINAGLEKCFNALEQKIANEADGGDTTAAQEEKREEETEKQASTSKKESPSEDPVEMSDSSEVESSRKSVDDDEIMAIDVEDEEVSDDRDEALKELENIEKKTKKILDDEESNKRPSSDSLSEPASKKTKLNDSIDTNEVHDVSKKKLKKLLKKMTRDDLEDMIQTKMIELMTNRSEIGQLRQQVDSYKGKVEKWQQRAQALSKQCTDLGTVMKKYITDTKTRPRDKVTPVKITRSVGLQVMSADQRRVQQQRQQPQVPARIATRPGQQTGAPGQRVVAAAPVRVVTPGKTLVNNSLSNQLKPTNGLVRGAVVAVSPRQSPALLPKKLPAGTVTTAAAAKLSPHQVAALRAGGGSVTITQSKPPPAKTPVAPGKAVIDVVNLSDDEDTPLTPAPVRITPVAKGPGSRVIAPGSGRVIARPTNGLLARVHPAPLPPMPQRQPTMAGWKLMPAKPTLKINRKGNGIVLSWNLNHTQTHATITSYQLYAYQETGNQLPDTSLWKKVGDVKALPLPMACTLTQFMAGNKYHFAVRALDCHNRLGAFSEPQNITLN